MCCSPARLLHGGPNVWRGNHSNRSSTGAHGESDTCRCLSFVQFPLWRRRFIHWGVRHFTVPPLSQCGLTLCCDPQAGRFLGVDIDDGQLHKASENVEFAELGHRIHLLKASCMSKKPWGRCETHGMKSMFRLQRVQQSGVCFGACYYIARAVMYLFT